MTTTTAPRKSTRKPAKPAEPVAESAFAAADPETLRGLYHDMLFVRRFEERTAQSYQQAKIGGYCHLNLGEEATVVGLGAAMRPTDYLFTNYREHGYALAKGIEPGRVMAELYGRSTGTSKGWGGSMHMYDTATRLLGGYAIVGGQVPLAVGAALAIDYRGGDEVVVCQMGEGHHEHRRVPRVAQYRGAVAAAGGVPGDQQSDRHGHHGRKVLGRTGSVEARRRLPDAR